MNPKTFVEKLSKFLEDSGFVKDESNQCSRWAFDSGTREVGAQSITINGQTVHNPGQIVQFKKVVEIGDWGTIETLSGPNSGSKYRILDLAFIDLAGENPIRKHEEFMGAETGTDLATITDFIQRFWNGTM